MKVLLYSAVFLVVALVEGRQYGYKPTKKDRVVVPVKKIPACLTACTLQLIPLDCREETFRFENGRRCRGCPIDICQDNIGRRGDNWDFNRGLGGNRWQNGGNRRGNDFRDLRGINGNGGRFIDRFQNGFIGDGQDSLLGDRLRNSFGSDTFRNRQRNNRW